MFTQKEIVSAQATASNFIKQCNEFRALLTEHELPMSFDLEKLKGGLRAQLFAKLLAVDKGLQMRFEMLRTEEAQQKLITDTIDLSGYAVVEDLQRRIPMLERTFAGLMLSAENRHIIPHREGESLNSLATQYGLDFNAWILSKAFDWTGKQHVLDYFKALAQPLTQMRALYRYTRQSDAGLNHVIGAGMASYFTAESNQGPIEPNEHFIMGHLVAKLQEQRMLAGFPGNMK